MRFQKILSIFNHKIFIHKCCLILFILTCLSAFVIKGQENNVIISGSITDKTGKNCPGQAVLINQNTSEGIFAGDNCRFTISIGKNDTLLASASGFVVKRLCFRDSVYRTRYFVVIRLDSLRVELSQINVYPHHNLMEIRKEEEQLGKVPSTDTYPDANILSPVSLLYERFNRLEQSKRKVAELKDEDLKRQVLKDLFHLYIKYDIINLSSSEFDKFIDYCNLSDVAIKNSTDYDLVMYIKYKYALFENNNSYYPSQPAPSGH